GLAISRQLAEKMGGAIGDVSAPGQGSTFWFTARFEKSDESTLELQSPREDLRGLRLLVVDDNETNRQIVHAQAASWGMMCDGAESAAAGLQALRAAAGATPFDL